MNLPIEPSRLADAFGKHEVPQVLLASIARHQANLAALVDSLRAAGVTRAQIETSVETLIASYRAELLDAIQAMLGRA